MLEDGTVCLPPGVTAPKSRTRARPDQIRVGGENILLRPFFSLEGGHASLATRVPPTAHVSQDFNNRTQKGQGPVVYNIVSAKWFSSWKEYSGFVLDDPDPNQDKKGGKNDPNEEAPNPGAINNEFLQDPTCPQALRKDIVENDDYVFVPEPVYKKLESWYSGGPSFPRKLLTGEETSIELYPHRFQATASLQAAHPCHQLT